MARDDDKTPKPRKDRAATVADESEEPAVEAGATDPTSDPDEERRFRQRLEAFIPELVKRTITAGLGAVMHTEEKIRGVTNDYQLPKDAVQFVMNTANTTKDEAFRIIARETRDFLQGVNLSQELAKMLTLLSVEVRTEFRFIPNDESILKVKPNVRPRVRIKRTKRDGTEETIDEDPEET